MDKLRRKEKEEENKAAAQFAEREYKIGMPLREQELAEGKQDMEIFFKKRQNYLEKIRKQFIEAKMQEIDLTDGESLFNRSKADKKTRRSRYHSIENEDPVNYWLESADKENTLTAPDKTVQNSFGQKQEHQTKSNQNQEPSTDPANAADRDFQLPPLIQHSPFEIFETGTENRNSSFPFPRWTEGVFTCWRNY